MLKSTRSKCFSVGRSAWNDPEQLSLKVLMALMYMAGLVAFQRYTGLLGPPRSKMGSTSSSPIYTSQYWHTSSSKMMRALLQVESNNLTEEDQLKLNTTANGTTEDVAADPLFPPDLFTMQEIKSGAVGFYILGKKDVAQG